MATRIKSRVYTGTNAPTDTVATSSTNSYYSQAVSLVGKEAFSIQVSWTNGSAMVGTFYLQVSNDPRVFEDPTNAVWFTTDEVFPANPNSNSSTTAETFSGNGYGAARLMYTNASGTGTLGPVWIHAN